MLHKPREFAGNLVFGIGKSPVISRFASSN